MTCWAPVQAVISNIDIKKAGATVLADKNKILDDINADVSIERCARTARVSHP